MTSGNSHSNRGPAAAAENRAAILFAARRLFAAQGYHVPLNAIAREAGVGQGVLYRHFPSRFDLALTVFEENFAELGRIAAQDDPEAFVRLWHRLTDLVIESAAFIEMVVDARHTHPDYDGASRFQALLEPCLDRARASGLVSRQLSTDTLLIAERALYGVVVTATDAAEARRASSAVNRAFGLPSA